MTIRLSILPILCALIAIPGYAYDPVGDFEEIFCNVIVSDSTIGQPNDYTTMDYAACSEPGELFDAGDKLYKFVVSDTSTLSIELEATDSAGLELFLLSNTIDEETLEDCPDTCIARTLAGDDLAITLIPGIYWITVDGAVDQSLLLTEEGYFDLAIRCQKDYTEITCGQIIEGSTVNRLNNYGILDYGACFEAVIRTYEAGDQLFRFEVTSPRTLDINLEKLDNEGLHLFLLSNAVDINDGSSCPGSCLGLSDTGSVRESIHAVLPVGVYWIMIDGDFIPGDPDIVDEGSFRLSIVCPRDFETIDCGDVVSSTTSGRISYRTEADYADCTPSAIYDGGDLTYQFEVLASDEITIKLNSLEGDDLDLVLLSSSVDTNGIYSPSSCLALSDTSTVSSKEEINIMLDVGVYFIVVDGGTIDGASEEGPFMLEVVCARLPIELVQFSVVPVAEGAELTWETASEINFEGFQVQRSGTGEDWIDLDWVPAKGSPDSPAKYVYLDPDPIDGVNYFRLNAIDFDGSNEFSNIIQIDYKKIGAVRVFPTLTSGQLTISGVTGTGPAIYEVRSSLGQLIKRGTVGSTNFSLDLSELNSGLIYVSVIDGQSVETFTVRKM